MSETKILAECRLALSKQNVTIFRNNTGMLRAENGRIVRFGLHIGSPDLVGWKSIVVTPNMIGKRIAVFTGIECKAERGKMTEAQQNFINAVKKAGGLTGVAHSAEEALEIVK